MWGICFKFWCVDLFLFLKLFNDNLNQLIWIVGQLFYALVNSITRALRPFFQKEKAGPHSWTDTIVRRHVVGVFSPPEPLGGTPTLSFSLPPAT